MNDKLFKYANIGLGVVIAIVIAIAGYIFYTRQAEPMDQVAEESQELSTTLATEASAVEASYIDVPGWQDRSKIKGDKEGITLEQAAAAGNKASDKVNPAANRPADTARPTVQKPVAQPVTPAADPAAASTAASTPDTSAASTAASTEVKHDWQLAAGQSDSINHYYIDKNAVSTANYSNVKSEGHKWVYSSNGADGHSKKCSVCGYVAAENESHDYGSDGRCKYCGFKKPAADTSGSSSTAGSTSGSSAEASSGSSSESSSGSSSESSGGSSSESSEAVTTPEEGSSESGSTGDQSSESGSSQENSSEGSPSETKDDSVLETHATDNSSDGSVQTEGQA